jgi:hypothetical protein
MYELIRPESPYRESSACPKFVARLSWRTNWILFVRRMLAHGSLASYTLGTLRLLIPLTLCIETGENV